MMFKLLLPIVNLLFVIVCAIQMPLSTIPTRFPASWGSELNIDELKGQIENYRVVINGRDIPCESEDEENVIDPSIDIDELISPKVQALTSISTSTKSTEIVSACEELGYRFDPFESEQKDGCSPSRERGLIDIIATQTMLDEKAEKKDKLFTIKDKMIRSLHKKGTFLLSEVHKVLKDDQYDIDLQRELLQLYLGGVAISFRDFMVIRRSYLPHEYDGEYFINSLLPEFPTDLIPAGDSYTDFTIAGKILLGPDPQTSPWNFKHIKKMWGHSTVAYDSVGVLSRDIVTLLKAPSKKNYIRALKWMNLQMMLGQIQLYSSIHGETEPALIPRSCQNHFNGKLPDDLDLEVREGEGDRIIENLLVNAGLSLSVDPNASEDIAERSQNFIEYFIDSVDTDPMVDGYSGLMPFEEYKNAVIGVEQAKGKFFFDHELEPGIDDRTAFETILNIKGYEALATFKDEEDGKVISYNGLELFQKILQRPNANEDHIIKTPNGHEIEVDATSQNLSSYMLEEMQRLGVSYYMKAIPDEVKTVLGNTIVKIDLPRLYGPASLRKWGLRLLADLSYDASKLKQSAFSKHLISACKAEGQNVSFCNKARGRRSRRTNNEQEVAIALSKFLSDFRDQDRFIPESRFYEEGFNHSYPVFISLWERLRDHTNLLPQARPNEFTFLVDQLESGNSWARLRLGYLTAMSELKSQEQKTTPAHRTNSELRCEYRNLTVKIRRLRKAASILGIDKSLNLFHANSILSKKEKINYWQQHIGNTNMGNSDLFQTIFDRGEDLYARMEHLSYKTFLTKKSALEYADKNLFDIKTSDYTELLDKVGHSDLASYAGFFSELYSHEGTIKEKAEFYSDNLPDEFSGDPEYAKLSFLLIDNSYKQVLYRAMIREASRIKKKKLEKRLDEFCQLEPSDYRTFKKLFYATTKAQNHVNQLAGLPGVPDSVMTQIEGLSPQESQDLLIGLGQMGLMITTSVLSGACTVVSGGLCAPIGVAVTAASYAVLASQLEIFRREFNRKIEANEDEAFIKEYSSIGLTDLSSVDKMHKSWFFPIFEAVSTITFVGTVTRGMQVGTKLARESIKAAVKNTSKAEFSRISKAVIHRGDTYLAESVLKYSSIKKTTSAMKRALKKPMEALALFKRGKLGRDALIKAFTRAADDFVRPVSKELLGGTDFSRSVKAVNRRTVNVVSTYWNNDPAQFARFLSSYNNEIFKGKKALAAIKAKNGIAYKIPVVGWAKTKIQTLRYDNLVKYSDDILRIQNEAANSSDLGKLLSNNMDELTDIFTKTGFRRREIPYMTLLQGGPHLGGVSGGKRIPFIYAGADGFMMKKFYSARGVLVYDSYKAAAKTKLGIPLVTNIADTTVEGLSAFQSSLRLAIAKSPNDQKYSMLKKYVTLEKQMVSQIFDYLQETGSDKLKAYSKKELQSIIFKPTTTIEKALGETILNLVPTEKLFKLKDLSDISYRAAEELSVGKGSTIDQFEEFLRALKVISIQREIIPVEYM
ncbi:MAG: hypothetical protein KAG61_08130 [Bacteriovoracaceae bacterium]|nr:hypothetical protein [Bacteriovoracaceae bacterium]